VSRRRGQSLSDWTRSVREGAPSRHLTAAEIALIPPELALASDARSVRLTDRAHNPFALGKVLVRGSSIYWHNAPADFTQSSDGRRALLMHELTHVWQYRTGRLSAASYLIWPPNWRYRYAVRERANLDHYAIEAQADIVEDWYRLRAGLPLANALGTKPEAKWLERIVTQTLRPQSLQG
jgi:hypothetical protein